MALPQHNHDHHENHEASVAFTVNHLVASLGVLNVKLHQYHWFVQGRDFFRLHEKFEELYDEVNEDFDAFAERLISIGKNPYATLEEFKEHSFIQEKVYDDKLTEEQMVSNVVVDYRTLRDVTLRGIHLAAEEGDPVTEDMLIGYKNRLDKTIWMLQAYLGKDALEGDDK